MLTAIESDDSTSSDRSSDHHQNQNGNDDNDGDNACDHCPRMTAAFSALRWKFQSSLMQGCKFESDEDFLMFLTFSSDEILDTLRRDWKAGSAFQHKQLVKLAAYYRKHSNEDGARWIDRLSPLSLYKFNLEEACGCNGGNTEPSVAVATTESPIPMATIVPISENACSQEEIDVAVELLHPGRHFPSLNPTIETDNSTNTSIAFVSDDDAYDHNYDQYQYQYQYQYHHRHRHRKYHDHNSSQPQAAEVVHPHIDKKCARPMNQKRRIGRSIARPASSLKRIIDSASVMPSDAVQLSDERTVDARNEQTSIHTASTIRSNRTSDDTSRTGTSFVPFLQLLDDAEMQSVHHLPFDGRVQLFFSTPMVRDSVARKLECIADQMRACTVSANMLSRRLANLPDYVSDEAVEQEWKQLEEMQQYEMKDSTVVHLDGYRPDYFVLKVHVKVFWKAFVVGRQQQNSSDGNTFASLRDTKMQHELIRVLLDPKLNESSRTVVYHSGGDVLDPTQLFITHEVQNRLFPV